MAYKNGESMRLFDLNSIGFKPNKILDIGAHTGQFYKWAKSVWVDVPIFMIEANECHEPILKNLTSFTDDGYLIATLGNSVRDVLFYTRKDKPHTEGASYYKELAYWDIPNLVAAIPKKLQILDEIFDNTTQFDLIKLDTQGSELDILIGGKHICSKAQYIILEVSLVDLNENAPSYNDVILFMKNFGFEEFITIGEHYRESEIVQKDLVFKKNSL